MFYKVKYLNFSMENHDSDLSENNVYDRVTHAKNELKEAFSIRGRRTKEIEIEVTEHQDGFFEVVPEKS